MKRLARVLGEKNGVDRSLAKEHARGADADRSSECVAIPHVPSLRSPRLELNLVRHAIAFERDPKRWPDYVPYRPLKAASGKRPAAGKRRTQHSSGALDPKSVRTALRAQIAMALAQLEGRAPADEEVHAARKCIKKARASLRLLRDVLGTETFQRENQALRDAAHPLSATRDAKVLMDVLDSMADRHAVDESSATTLRRSLIRKRKRLQGQAAFRSGIVFARQALRAVDRRASRWPLSAGDGTLVIRSLQRVYRGGRRALAAATADRSSELLHEWRKQVKYLWHQLQLFEPLPPEIQEIAEASHKLSDYLGEDHDLAVLRENVLAKKHLLSRRSLESTLGNIAKRQLPLERKAFALGRRVFAGKPATFAARVRRRGK